MAGIIIDSATKTKLDATATGLNYDTRQGESNGQGESQEEWILYHFENRPDALAGLKGRPTGKVAEFQGNTANSLKE